MTTHGHTRGYKVTLTWRSWRQMRQRVLNPNYGPYKNYGGRGIKICPAWDSYEQFLSDLGPRPPGTTLERKDNNGNYEPGNCVWATPKTQAYNRRTNLWLTFKGRTQTLVQWASELGMKKNTLSRRLKAGWSVEEALTVRVTKGNSHFTHSPQSAEPERPEEGLSGIRQIRLGGQGERHLSRVDLEPGQRPGRR